MTSTSVKQTFKQAWIAQRPEGIRFVFQSRFIEDEMKNIGWKFDNKGRIWVAPPLVSNLNNLLRLYPSTELSPSLKSVVSSPSGYRILHDVSTVISPSLWAIAKEHQKEALQRMYNSPHKGYLLELGKRLGKSFTSIAFADAIKAKNILIVCNKTLIPNWIHEILNWTSEEAVNSHGCLPADTKWNVTNYETLLKHNYSQYQWDLVVIDESVQIQHRAEVKNADGDIIRKGTKRTASVAALRANAGHMILLSASPISKHADGLFPQFQCLFPTYFTSYWRFVFTYCTTLKTVWGIKITGTREDIDFAEEFKDLAYSVRTESVIDMDITFETVEIDLAPEQVQVYDDLMQEFTAELEGAQINAVNKISRLIRLAETVSDLSNLGPDWPNISAKEDKLLEILPNYPGPHLIWIHWSKTGSNLYDRMVAAGYSVGLYTGKRESEDALNQFKAGKIDNLVISISSGKYGLTLPARTVFYVDRIWDGDAYNQSLSRAVGLEGFERSQYHVVTLIVPKSADDLITENLAGKMVSIAAVSNNDLIRLLGGLK